MVVRKPIIVLGAIYVECHSYLLEVIHTYYSLSLFTGVGKTR